MNVWNLWPNFTAYFVITAPTQDTQWVNGAANRVTWSKGVQDGIDEFDVELSRMTSDGLTFVARNGESRHKSILLFGIQINFL